MFLHDVAVYLLTVTELLKWYTLASSGAFYSTASILTSSRDTSIHHRPRPTEPRLVDTWIRPKSPSDTIRQLVHEVSFASPTLTHVMC